MIITASKAARESVVAGALSFPFVTEPVRKHFYDETLEYRPHESLQLLLNDPTLFNKLSTENLKEHPELIKPKRNGFRELCKKDT